MNVLTAFAPIDRLMTRTEVASQVAMASRAVPPLWPLESPIAVNPLAGLEHLPFREAVSKAAHRFAARESLPLAAWRALLDEGRIDETALRDAAIGELGGLYEAMSHIAEGVTALDLLLARLVDLPQSPEAHTPSGMPRDAAFIAKWCAAFFDQGIAASAMPHRELGLYKAVLALAAHDGDFTALTGSAGRQLLLSVPRDPLEAIAEGLAVLDKDDQPLDYLEDLVARLPGWAGHIRWRTDHADPGLADESPVAMADLLALWILLERAGTRGEGQSGPAQVDASAALLAHFGLLEEDLDDGARARLHAIAVLGEGQLGQLFMTAAEWTYANALVPQLQLAAGDADKRAKPDAQLVFCIDVRSEPFRRALEIEGNYETFGYAGFFGLPIALQPFGGKRRKRLLPVLLSPQHAIAEQPKPGHSDDAGQIAADQQRRGRAKYLLDAAKLGTTTAFATAEATGSLAGLAMAARTLAPRLLGKMTSMLGPDREGALYPALAPAGQHSPMTLEDKVGYASALFRLTGMAAETARLVVFVGHGGSAVNNPYAGALDCGACGGHAGGSNARLLAAILNDPQVREALAGQDIAIPASTHFLAAEHNTTSDQVRIFDTCQIPASHEDDLARLTESLERAGRANLRQRADRLERTPEELVTGAMHWGEVRPEWGLSANAGFIVGPRSLSQELDLEGRAFLHSYDWRQDPDGTALTTILTAPMIVAQWINCQYLFSTLDNRRYGSGDKVTHNVMGRIGVVQGNGGDLQVGLPRQSLFRDDGTPYHVPQRLLTIVHAPPDRVRTVIEENDILMRLFGKGWVHLVVIDPATGKCVRWSEDDVASLEGANPHSMTL